MQHADRDARYTIIKPVESARAQMAAGERLTTARRTTAATTIMVVAISQRHLTLSDASGETAFARVSPRQARTNHTTGRRSGGAVGGHRTRTSRSRSRVKAKRAGMT